MSRVREQFVNDDHLNQERVRDPITRWSTARFLRTYRPGEVIKDERVPAVLGTLRTPTFITIDDDFKAAYDEAYDVRSILRSELFR